MHVYILSKDDMMFENAITILYLCFLILTCIGVGGLLICKIHLHYTSLSEFLLFSFAIGLGVLSYSIYFFGMFQLLYAELIYVLLVVLGIIAGFGWYFKYKNRRHIIFDKFVLSNENNEFDIKTSSLPYIKWTSLTLLISILLLGLLVTFTPAIGNDSLVYHLAVPKLFLNKQGFYFIPGNIFAHYPLNTEMLFLIALALQGDILAKGINYFISLVLLSGMFLFARTYISRSPFSTIFPLLIFSSLPTVFTNSHMAYSDLTLSFYTLVSLYAFLNWYRRSEKGWMFLVALFIGICMSTKYGALFYLPLGCLGILYVCQKSSVATNIALKNLILFIIVVIIVGSPYYLKNWLLTGNPLYPFFYDFFGGRGWSLKQAEYYDYFLRQLGMGRDFQNYILLPWNMSFKAHFNSPYFDGVIGPVFLLTLPFFAGLNKVQENIKIIGIFSLLYFTFWMFSVQQMRYLIPVFPFLSLIVGYIMVSYQKEKQKRVSALITILVIAGIAFNIPYILKGFYRIKPVDSIIGKEDRNSFLNRMLPSHEMFQYINKNLPDNSKIFFIYMKNYGFLSDKSYYSDSIFESFTLDQMINQAKTLKEFYNTLISWEFSHILYDVNYTIGRLSTLSEENKKFFFLFQKRYLKLEKNKKNRYYLYRLM